MNDVPTGFSQILPARFSAGSHNLAVFEVDTLRWVDLCLFSQKEQGFHRDLRRRALLAPPAPDPMRNTVSAFRCNGCVDQTGIDCESLNMLFFLIQVTCEQNIAEFGAFICQQTNIGLGVSNPFQIERRCSVGIRANRQHPAWPGLLQQIS